MMDWYEQQAILAARDHADLHESRFAEPRQLSYSERVDRVLHLLRDAVAEGRAVEALSDLVEHFGAPAVRGALPLMRRAAAEARERAFAERRDAWRWNAVIRAVESARTNAAT
jgi:hypothetical protein